MKPTFRDDELEIWIGDVRLVLAELADSGTVGAVANALGRRAILVELDRRMLPELLRRTVRELDFYALGLGEAPATIPEVDQRELFGEKEAIS